MRIIHKKSINILFISLLIFSMLVPASGFAAAEGSQDTITVADAIANNSGNATVEGYIVGYIKSQNSVTRDESAFDIYNVALADNAGETDVEKMLFVQVGKNFREDWGLKNHPELLDEKVAVTGSLEAYHSREGLKSPTDFQLVKDTMTVAEAIANNSGEAAVEGHIVGKALSKDNVIRENFDGDTNIVLADEAGETDTSKMLFVKLEGSDRDEWGLQSNPDLLDQTIIAEGSLEAYFGAPGLKNVSQIQFADGTEPPGEALELISIREAHDLGEGDVLVKGQVTAKLKNTIHIQDGTAGIAVRPTSLDVELGEEITVKGSLQDYRGLLQLSSAAVEENLGSKVMADPVVLNGSDVGEAYESQLAAVENVHIDSVYTGDGWANYTVTADGESFLVRDERGTLDLDVDTTYDKIIGIVSQFDNDYQIIPRGTQDVVQDASIVQAVYAQPGAGAIPKGTSVTLQTHTTGAVIHYTLDGSQPTQDSPVYSDPIEVNEDMVIKAVAYQEGLDPSPVTDFSYTVYEAENTQIHEIQGTGHVSPLKDKVVTDVEGVVTYKYDIRGSHYFHLQNQEDQYDGDPRTSEGIVVYTGKEADVNEGDLVHITGKVDEYFIDGYDDKAETDLPVTQINARDDQGGAVDVIDSNVALPEAIEITSSAIPEDIIGENGWGEDFETYAAQPDTYAIDFWESIEGMRVVVKPSKAVAPQQHGDLVVVSEDYPTNTVNGGIRLTPEGPNAQTIQFKVQPNGPARDLKVKTGDQFTEDITGVVNYGFSNYKVYADLADVEKAHVASDRIPNASQIEPDDEKLTIASYNVENFSANTSSGETPEAKATRIAEALADEMNSPDIIGLVEMQDNNGQDYGPVDADASESYQRLIDKIKEVGGPEYAFVNINPEYNQDGGAPDSNIRVGYLYNPERVSLKSGMDSGDATTAVGYEDGALTLNPGRIDPANDAFNSSRKSLAAQFEFNGEDVVVVANHFNSKRGDDAVFGSNQPPVLGSEDQRMEMAKAVNGFVTDVLADNSDANIVVLGDMNDFEFSNPLHALKGNELVNMIDHVSPEERYTYVFQGNSQVLDHMLVSKNLSDAAVADIYHVNADYTDMHGRASDHDPVLLQVDLKADAETPIPDVDKVYQLTDYKTGKLVLNANSVYVSINGNSEIKNGIRVMSHYAILEGETLADTEVEIKPKKKGTIVDFRGATVKKVIVRGSKLKEIRGAENIQEIDYIKGANPEEITFTDSSGAPIGDPGSNQSPVIVTPIPNQSMTAGEPLTIQLSDYFSDPDGDDLTYNSELGTVQGDTLTLDLDEGTYIVAVTASDRETEVTETFRLEVLSEAPPVEGYYQGAEGKEGDALKAALHDIIKDHEALSYRDVWAALRVTDEDPDNPDNVRLFYSGDSRSKDRNGGMVGDWNREHVWAKSHGDFGTRRGPGTDIHHLRPTDVQVNSSRGNLDFDNGGSPIKNCDDCKRSSNSFEAPDDVKGDVARILFYMTVRYEGIDYVDLELNEKLNNGSNPFHGKLSTLLEWHQQDPVDAYEQQRNDKIFDIQGNRNPFIDHPEWVHDIWPESSTTDINFMPQVS